MPTIAVESVKSLLIELKFDGQALSSGTAFVVQTRSGPHLITNRHNVTGRHQETGDLLSKTGGVPNQLVVVHNRKGRLGNWTRTSEQLFSNEIPLWKEHPTLGGAADFIALPLTQLNDVELYPYDTEVEEYTVLVGLADTVSVIGFPFGLAASGAFGIWATGFVASELDIDYNNSPVFLIDCRSRRGQSGSPVIAYRRGGMVTMTNHAQIASGDPISRFMGIYSGRINAESDLGMVWKASAVNELVRSL
jgi:Trypsin-like peptidase domain